MDDRWRRWERTRKAGPLQFIFLWGICGWGLSVGFLFALVFWFIAREGSLFEILRLSLLLFPVGGALFGAGVWYFCEKGYTESLENHRNEERLRQLEDDVDRLQSALDLKSLGPSQPDTNIKTDD